MGTRVYGHETEKPSLDELTHFGVKGMKWGVRKNRGGKSQGMSTKKKVLIGAAVVGAGVAVALIAKNGRIPSATLSPSQWESIRTAGVNQAKAAKKSKTVEAAHQASVGRALLSDKKFQSTMDTFLKEIADAHADQTNFMLRTNPGYNPRANPFTPKSEIKRLSGAR